MLVVISNLGYEIFRGRSIEISVGQIVNVPVNIQNGVPEDDSRLSLENSYSGGIAIASCLTLGIILDK